MEVRSGDAFVKGSCVLCRWCAMRVAGHASVMRVHCVRVEGRWCDRAS